jgi:proliferating cell nuclear antigen PCNA
MDSSHVCLYNVKFDKEWFFEYNYELKKNNICVNSQYFHSILATANENLCISCDEQEDSIIIVMETKEENKNSITKNEFKLNLVDLTSDILNITENEYDLDFCILANDFIKITTQMLIFDSSIEICCSEQTGELIMSTKGVMGDMSVKVDTEKLLEYSITESAVIKATFSLSFLHKKCLTHKLSEQIYVSISENTPIKLTYYFDNDKKSYLNYFLAPKVNDNDD